MVAEGIPNGDGEGEILRSVRELVGEDIPIMNTFDLHSTVTKLKVENSDAIFGYDTNPHVDAYERGVEAAETIIRTLKGKIKPIDRDPFIGSVPSIPKNVSRTHNDCRYTNFSKQSRIISPSELIGL